WPIDPSATADAVSGPLRGRCARRSKLAGEAAERARPASPGRPPTRRPLRGSRRPRRLWFGTTQSCAGVLAKWGAVCDRAYLAAVCESLYDKLECHFPMLLDGRQGLLRKLLQLGFIPRSLFLLEKPDHLVVVGNHVAHVLVIKGLAMQSLELFAHPLVL